MSELNRFRCAVRDCHSTKADGKSFFAFPKDKKRLNQWIENLQIENDISKWKKVCSCHFEKKYIYYSEQQKTKNSGKKLLSNKAVPTLYLPIMKKNENSKIKLSKGAFPTEKLPQSSFTKKLCIEIIKDRYKRVEERNRKQNCENLIYDENIGKQKAVTEKSCNEDLSDHSYTMSQNLGNPPPEEKNENDNHVEVIHEFIESDDLIIMDPLLLTPNVSPSSDNCTNTLKVKSNKEILETPPKRKCLTNKTKQESFKTRMENKILVTKLKIMERECYLKDLEILKIENELDVKTSKYTEHFYKTIDS